MGNIEAVQIRVAVLDVGVALAGKIAAMDMGAAERVADAVLRVKIGPQNFLLLVRRQLVERLRRGIRQGAADADDGLESLGRIHKNVRLLFVHRQTGGQLGFARFGQPLPGILGGDINVNMAGGLSGSTLGNICQEQERQDGSNKDLFHINLHSIELTCEPMAGSTALVWEQIYK